MDTMPVIRKRHPEIAERLVAKFEMGPHTPFLRAAVDAQRGLPGIMGFEPPSWQAAALGARPLPREPDDFEPSCVRQGWQHEAISWVEQQFRQELFVRVPVQVQALIRSRGGPGGGAALAAVPISCVRVVLLRRLRQSLTSLNAVADVAVPSTLLAIIVQLVPEWGYWVVESVLWRALQRGCAVRQEDVLERMCS